MPKAGNSLEVCAALRNVSSAFRGFYGPDLNPAYQVARHEFAEYAEQGDMKSERLMQKIELKKWIQLYVLRPYYQITNCLFLTIPTRY